MDFSLTDEQAMLRDTVSKLMARHAPAENLRLWNVERRFPDEVYDAWVEAGLLMLPIPEEYGGMGGSAMDMALVVEEISKTSTDLCMAFSSSLFCALNIVRKGSAEQKQTWLPRIMDGRTKMAISISEPDAGSDLAPMKTFAAKDGAEYVINGQKLWNTGAALKNTVLNVYLKTDRQADTRKGMSLFLVENDAAGLELNKLDMLGRRCIGTYEVFFRDVRISEAQRIGEEGDGWSCVLSGLQYERAMSAASSVGGAQAVVDAALAYAKARVQFGRPIGTFQAISHRLAEMQTEVDASRLLMLRAAWLVSEGKDALKEITMAKLHASETYVKVASEAVQIMGAYGLNTEYDMERHYRDAKSATIAAGTSETQRNLIARLMGLK